MLAGLAKVKRLRGRSWRELKVRGRQGLAKLGERALRLSTGEISDQAFLGHVSPGHVEESAEATAAATSERIHKSVSSHHTQDPSFFPSLGHREEIANTMGCRFPRERQEIIDRADRATAGRFDLLGFKNLSFGNPPDWLLEPILNKRTPLDHWSTIKYLDPAVAGDKKITWELNRHQHFVTLGQAYWLTGDEKYAEAFITQATSWMDANPPKRGINWTSSLELALRSISWIWAFHMFVESPRLTVQLKLRLLKQLLAHGLHLQSYLSYYFSPNTHLTGEALGLFYLGTALKELRCAETWRNLGLEILLGELTRQVRDDGVYFEQASYYHRYTADFYTHFLILGRATSIDLPQEVDEKLEKMISHLMWIMRPDGSSPLIGDDDGGRLIVLGPRGLGDFRDTVATAAALYDRGDWKRAAGQLAVETLWLLGPAGVDRYDSIRSSEPLSLSRIYGESGIAVMRDGWSKDSSYTLIDCGPHGSLANGHAHADALSIEFAAVGKSWIIDPGTFTYTADSEMRDWFRSTQAHNTVTVDGKSQSVSSGPFSWNHVAKTSLVDFITGDGFDYVEASHDGYERFVDPIRHTRLVINPKASPHNDCIDTIGSYLILHDSFSGSGIHEYAISYHLAPDCAAFAVENHVTVTEPGGRRLNLAVFGDSKIEARITRSWISRAYGQREPSLVVVFEARGKGPQEFTSLIVPATDGQSVALGSHPVDFAAARGCQVVTQTGRDLLLINSGGRQASCGSLAGACHIAWARFENDGFVRGFLIGGHRFETSDGFGFRSAAPVSHCSLWRTEKGTRGSINGTTLVELGVAEQARKSVIDGSIFEISQPVVSFRTGSTSWDSSDRPNEAIN